MTPSPSAVRVAARYLGLAGGTLSWEVHLGGDARNWEVLGAEDGRSWSMMIQQLARAFKGIRTRHGGTVDDVTTTKVWLRVYFDYEKALDADDALYDAENALKTQIKMVGDRDRAMEWVLHGAVDGHRSNLELKNEAIEDGF